jgi:hypothetical protein
MTTRMVRKQFYILDQQDKQLKRLAELYGLSEAEVVRKAIQREFSGAPSQRFVPDRSAWQELLFYLDEREKIPTRGQPYHWNREEIYTERENRWLQNRKEE